MDLPLFEFLSMAIQYKKNKNSQHFSVALFLFHLPSMILFRELNFNKKKE